MILFFEICYISSAQIFCFEQVMQVVKKTESLEKISFLAHSLGGLIARYAVAVLYTPNVSSDQPDDIAASTATSFETLSNDSSIAGLEAINFITLATPHLGVRGNKQVYFASPYSPISYLFFSLSLFSNFLKFYLAICDP